MKWGMGNVKMEKINVLNGKTKRVESTLSRFDLHNFKYDDVDEVVCCTNIEINGVEFRKNLYVCLQVSHITQKNLPIFGIIKEIIMKDKNVFLKIELTLTLGFDTSLNAYYITEVDNNDDSNRFVNVFDLAYFKPLSYWTISNSDYKFISLRHILL